MRFLTFLRCLMCCDCAGGVTALCGCVSHLLSSHWSFAMLAIFRAFTQASEIFIELNPFPTLSWVFPMRFLVDSWTSTMHEYFELASIVFSSQVSSCISSSTLQGMDDSKGDSNLFHTLVLCAYFPTECGSPGIRKSMSASFTNIGSWLSSWSAMDFSILSRSTSSLTLNVLLSWAARTRELSCASAVWRVSTGRSVLSWVCSTLRLIMSSETTSNSVLSDELSSSQKKKLISWERDLILPSCMLSNRPDLSRVGFGVYWVSWKFFACRVTSPSDCRATS